MSVTTVIRGKIQAAQSLTRIARLCRNWPAVWSAWRGRGAVPEFVFRSGLRLSHGPEDDLLSLFQEIFLHEHYTGDGFYHPQSGDTVIDLGANIGTFAVFLQHKARGITVHCFEPGVDTRKRLEHNIRINHLEANVQVYPIGVSDTAKSLVLYGNRFAGSRSTVAVPGTTDEGEEITCVTLSEAIRMTGADRVDLLKIDVEGAEVDILTERDPDTWAKIQRVALEFHGSLRPGARQAVKTTLTARGFRIVRVIESTPGATDGVLQAVR